GVSGFVQTERSVLAQFGDGGEAKADLLVGADGLRSSIRQQCLPQLVPSYVGYVAWRALIAEAAFPPTIHRELFDSMVFCLPPGGCSHRNSVRWCAWSRNPSCSRSTISKRHGWRSAGLPSSATRLSSRGRTSLPASPRRRTMPQQWLQRWTPMRSSRRCDASR